MNASVIFSTTWGTRYGGINSFNRDLCIALANVTNSSLHQVVCVVPFATDRERQEAAESNVNLLAVRTSNENSTLRSELLPEIHEKLSRYNVLWWVGHDVITGPISIAARREYGGRCAILHHMTYEAYLPFFDKSEHELIDLQRTVLNSCDVVFGIGPKLLEAAREKTRSRKDLRIVELIPGLAEVEGLPPSNRFSAIVFGRIDAGNDRLKQAKLAVAAFGRARGLPGAPLGDDATLTVVGLDPLNIADETRALQEILDTEAKRAVPLHGIPYTENHQQLLEDLRHHSACLMLSLHEGFGLTGWESIAAEVPLIISRNTGVYLTVENYLGGVGRGCLKAVDIRGSSKGQPYREEDVEIVSNAILQIAENQSSSKTDAQILKRFLNLACTWEHTAIKFSLACDLPLSRTMPKNSLDKWTPDLLMSALLRGSNIVDEASRRTHYFDNIWKRIAFPAEISQRIIVFGGVSQSFCTTEAAERFHAWLSNYPDAKIFLCYETEEAADARARALDEKNLETASGLASSATARMKEKQKRVEALPTLISNVSSNIHINIHERVCLIPIRKPLSTYVLIIDTEAYLTPLFEKRASESLSFALSGQQARNEVAGSMIYHLENIEPKSPGNTALLNEIRAAFPDLMNSQNV